MNLTHLNDQQLVELQSLLERAENSTSFVRGIVGERCAGMSLFFGPVEHLLSVIYPEGDPHDRSAALGLRMMRAAGWQHSDCLFYLGCMEEYFDAMRSSYPERLRRTARIVDRVSQTKTNWDFYNMTKLISGMLLPGIATAVVKDAEALALVRAAVTSLAVERYRLRHERLPEGIDQIVPDFLSHARQDPFDGRTLHYNVLKSGYLVYSVGHDEEDNNGEEGRRGSTPRPSDIPFRLFR